MPAASRRPGSPPRPGSKSGVPRWLWIVGAGVLLLAVYFVYTRRAQAATLNTSGMPRPDLTGSAADPSGGASSIPGQLPDGLLIGPNTITEQVQATDTADGTAPTMTSTGYVLTSPQFKSYQQTYAQQQVQHQQFEQAAVNTIADQHPFTTSTGARVLTAPSAPAAPKPRLPGLRGGF